MAAQRVPRLAVGGQFAASSPAQPVQELALPRGGRDTSAGRPGRGSMTSSAATDASTERGTRLAAEQRAARIVRKRGTVRDRNSSPSSGSTPASWALATCHGSTGEPTVGIARTGIVGVAGTFRCDGTIRERDHRLGPSLVRPGRDAAADSAGPPETSRIAQSSIDLPAPVSPVMAVMPAGRRNRWLLESAPDCGYRVLRASGSCHLPSRSPGLSESVPATPASPATATPAAYAAAGNVCP